jgi:hypothetical protein
MLIGERIFDGNVLSVRCFYGTKFKNIWQIKKPKQTWKNLVGIFGIKNHTHFFQFKKSFISVLETY